MGELPQERSITVDFESQFRVTLISSDFSAIMKAFLLLLPQFLEDFFQKVLVGFAEYEMSLPRKSFACRCCGNDRDFVWKTRHGKATTILTWFRWLTLQQLQVLCKSCGHKQYITRTLLGMEAKQRVPDATRRKLALMGALTSYRVSAKIGQMFGWAVDKMTIWQSVQRIGRQMEFLLDENEEPRGEADGTGIGITGIAKRGKELKILVQYKKGGGIRVLTTNTNLSAKAVALKYKELWMVEQTFRDMKSALDTRPIYHKEDETIRGHVFCSFLALTLKKELENRLVSQGLVYEWVDIKQDLRALQEVLLEEQGTKIAVRTECVGVCCKVFTAIGVAVPPIIRIVGK